MRGRQLSDDLVGVSSSVSYLRFSIRVVGVAGAYAYEGFGLVVDLVVDGVSVPIHARE